MAIFDFVRQAGQKILGKGSAGGSGGRSASDSGSGSSKQQQQFSGGSPGQQQSSGGSARSGSSGASGASGSTGSARGSNVASGTGSASSGSGSGTAQAGGRTTSQSAAPTSGNIDQPGSAAIRDYIMSMDDVDAPDDLVVLFDADDGTVIIEGTVDDDDTAELIVLVAGNIDGVAQVDDRMTRSVEGEHGSQSGTASRFHTVSEGETLASLAKQYYSDDNQAGRIADANGPVMGDNDQVRAGQTIRIPQDGSGSTAASSSPGAGLSGKTTH